MALSPKAWTDYLLLRSLCQSVTDVWGTETEKEENNHKEEHAESCL